MFFAAGAFSNILLFCFLIKPKTLLCTLPLFKTQKTKGKHRVREKNYELKNTTLWWGRFALNASNELFTKASCFSVKAPIFRSFVIFCYLISIFNPVISSHPILVYIDGLETEKKNLLRLLLNMSLLAYWMWSVSIGIMKTQRPFQKLNQVIFHLVKVNK